MPGVAFAGAVDPGGDRFGGPARPGQLFATTHELLAEGPIDFAVISVPTEEHLAAVAELAPRRRRRAGREAAGRDRRRGAAR